MLAQFSSWLSKNKAAVALYVVCAAAIVAMTFVGGCSLSDLMTVSVPQNVQSAIRTPPKITLSQAASAYQRWAASIEAESAKRQAEYKEWVECVQIDANEFSEAIQRGWTVHQFVGSFIDFGIGAAQTAGGATIPGGAIVFGALAGLSGLFTRKPGTQSELDRSYDMGAEEAKKNLLAGAAALGQPNLTAILEGLMKKDALPEIAQA